MASRRRRFPSASAVLVLALVAGVGWGPQQAMGAPGHSLTVFAAASLTEAYEALGRVVQQRHPGLTVTFNFAGSQQLATQLEEGARADVFASADVRWMEYARRRGLLSGPAREFARNRLVVILPAANPARIARLQDLGGPAVKIVLEAETVPAGQYSREALAKLERAPGFPRDYAQRVLRNVVSEEDNVKAVVTKVQLGEADAGIVYQSDVTAAVAGRVTVLPIPARYNVVARYPIALLKGAPNREAGREFIDLVLSPLGQRVLRDRHFIPVNPP